MIQAEEKARQQFEETKDILWLFCLSGSIDHFQKHIEDFIQERLSEAAGVVKVQGTEEEDSTYLHGL